MYLNAAALGDVPILRQSLEEIDVPLNVNCVDYMGRSALHLAVDNENMDSIELLLDRLQFECIEESLLHAISKVRTSCCCCCCCCCCCQNFHFLRHKKELRSGAFHLNNICSPKILKMLFNVLENLWIPHFYASMTCGSEA